MKTASEMYQDIQSLIANGRDVAATEALEQLLKSEPNYAAAYHDLGILYHKAGDEDKAQKCPSKAVEADPENGAVHEDLSIDHQRRSCRRAVRHFEEAIRLEPQNGVYKKNYAAFLYGAGDIRKALEIYVDLMIQEPRDIEALMAAGHICRVLQRQEDAEVFYKRALRVEPSNSEARKCLESLEDERSHPDAL